jgi:hypothetical protein
LQDVEARWYRALARGTPDFSVYAEDLMVSETWACWRVYSRKYATLMRDLWPDPPFQSLADVGCGCGLTSAAFRTAWPAVAVTATQLPGTAQYRVAERLGKRFGFKVLPKLTGRADLLFASEYLEHFQAPLDHLDELLSVGRPRWLVMANAFGSKAVGHFDEYLVDGRTVPGKAVGRLLGRQLRSLGWLPVRTGWWNNRPAVWERAR